MAKHGPSLSEQLSSMEEFLSPLEHVQQMISLLEVKEKELRQRKEKRDKKNPVKKMFLKDEKLKSQAVAKAIEELRKLESDISQRNAVAREFGKKIEEKKKDLESKMYLLQSTSPRIGLEQRIKSEIQSTKFKIDDLRMKIQDLKDAKMMENLNAESIFATNREGSKRIAEIENLLKIPEKLQHEIKRRQEEMDRYALRNRDGNLDVEIKKLAALQQRDTEQLKKMSSDKIAALNEEKENLVEMRKINDAVRIQMGQDTTSSTKIAALDAEKAKLDDKLKKLIVMQAIPSEIAADQNKLLEMVSHQRDAIREQMSDKLQKLSDNTKSPDIKEMLNIGAKRINPFPLSKLKRD